MTRPLSFSLALSACAFLAGCGDDNAWKPRHPTRVQVFYKGKPPVGATVVLHPVGGENSVRTVPSRGIVQEDGTAVFTTYTPDDGVPAGEYHVVAFWFENGVPPNKLPARYFDPQTSGMRVTIAEGDNRLETINLTK